MSKRRSQRKRKAPQPEPARADVSRRFLLDENVPTSIARFLAARGHEVRRVQDELVEGASDRLLVDWADTIEATVVTFNVKHFEPLIYRAPTPGRKRHPHYDPTKHRRFAGAVFMECTHPLGVARLEQFIDLIEHEFSRRARKSDTRVIMRIAAHEVCLDG